MRQEWTPGALPQSSVSQFVLSEGSQTAPYPWQASSCHLSPAPPPFDKTFFPGPQLARHLARTTSGKRIDPRGAATEFRRAVCTCRRLTDRSLPLAGPSCHLSPAPPPFDKTYSPGPYNSPRHLARTTREKRIDPRGTATEFRLAVCTCQKAHRPLLTLGRPRLAILVRRRRRSIKPTPRNSPRRAGWDTAFLATILAGRFTIKALPSVAKRTRYAFVSMYRVARDYCI